MTNQRRAVRRRSGISWLAFMLSLSPLAHGLAGDPDLRPAARLMLHTGEGSGGAKFSAGYFRGPIRIALGVRSPVSAGGTNLVTVFTSDNRRELIVAVDHGPVFRSTNSGMAWTAITEPGLHKFPLSTTRDGAGLWAHVPIDPPPPVFDKPQIPTHPSTASGATNAPPVAAFYAAVRSPEGERLILASDPSSPAPALIIRNISGRVTVAWPAQFTNFVLEHNPAFDSGGWSAVTNPVVVVGGENQVAVQRSIITDFFRLRSR